MEKNTSHSRAACCARSIAAMGSASVNQTTSGRQTDLPQSQGGGEPLSPGRVRVPGSCGALQSKHLVFKILPCSSITSVLPALRCRPSMFCVIRVKCSNRVCILASAKWPGFGATLAIAARRS